MSSVPLSIVLDVLDRAEASIAQPVSRTDLIETVQALQTSHTEAALIQAVDAHLAQAPVPAAPPRSYAFGWRRPTTPTQMETSAQRWACLDRWRGAVMPSLAVVGAVVLPIVMIVMAPDRAQMNGADMLLIAIIMGVYGALLGALTGGLIRGLLYLWGSRFRRQVPRVVQTKKLHDYLRHEPCRAYLRALQNSAVSRLLEGDVERLDAIEEELRDQALLRTLKARAEDAEVTQAQTLASLLNG